jgi:hypothetical protein
MSLASDSHLGEHRPGIIQKENFLTGKLNNNHEGQKIRFKILKYSAIQANCNEWLIWLFYLLDMTSYKMQERLNLDSLFPFA